MSGKTNRRLELETMAILRCRTELAKRVMRNHLKRVGAQNLRSGNPGLKTMQAYWAKRNSVQVPGVDGEKAK